MQVYEYITYDNEKHISLASFPGMQERTIITSSLSKTFSVTGIKTASNQTALEVFLSSDIIANKNGINSFYQVGGLDGQLHQLFLHPLSEIFISELQIVLHHLFRKLR